jgi:UDP-N-acetylmuramate dehydrogenase
LNLVTPENLVQTLREAIGEERVRTNVPLAPLTTFHVGGPADVLVETHAEHELHMAASLARGVGVPLTVLGGGSNVLIGDRGIRGVVVLVRDRSIEQVDEHGVRAAAGLTINGLVRWTVGRGLAGIEAWAGTPGTVGGAIHGNAHFRGRNISVLVREVRVLMPGRGALDHGDVRDIPVGEMGFAYDTSRLQGSGEVALSAVFNVTPGKTEELRATARESLAFRKRTQPLDVPSAGCIFQNPDPAREQVPDGIPPSAGALIDRAGLKGSTSGGARVSPTHGNFIVHDGAASAAEIRALIERCKSGVASRYGVHLREEIVYLGEF